MVHELNNLVQQNSNWWNAHAVTDWENWANLCEKEKMNICVKANLEPNKVFHLGTYNFVSKRKTELSQQPSEWVIRHRFCCGEFYSNQVKKTWLRCHKANTKLIHTNRLLLYVTRHKENIFSNLIKSVSSRDSRVLDTCCFVFDFKKHDRKSSKKSC